MADLHIALQDGFFEEEVVVRVDGREVYRNGELRTRTQIGLADSFAVDLASAGYSAEGNGDEPLRIEVVLPGRGVEATTRLRPEETPFLGVSVRDDQVVFRPSATPFGYL